jgi:hypothetical protein
MIRVPKGIIDRVFRPRIIALCCIVLLAFALAAQNVGTQSLWYDEAYSVLLSQTSLPNIISQTASLDFNTPLHYLLLMSWLPAASSSEFAARFVSVLAGTLNVALAGKLIQVTVPGAGVRGITLGTLLVALSPALIPAIQEARMYALMACVSTAAALALALAQRPTRTALRWWPIWAGLSVAAFLTHILGAIVAAGQGIVVVAWWVRRASRRARIVSASAACVAAAAMGLFVLYILSFGTQYGVTFGARPAVADLLVRSAAALALPRLEPAAALPMAAFAGVLVILLAMSGGGAARHTALTCAIGLAGFAVLGALSGKFAARYPIIIATPLLALAGAVLGRAWRSRLRMPALALAAVLVTASLGGQLAWRSDARYHFEDFRGAVARIRAERTSGDAVLMLAGHADPALAYYWPGGIRNRDWHAIPDDVLLNLANQLDYDAAAPLLNRALTGKTGVWLLRWQDDVIDPAHTVRSLLRRRAVGLTPDIESAQYHGLRLEHYTFNAPFEALPLTVPPLTSQILPNGPDIGLASIGCHVFELPRLPAELLEINCFWRIQPGQRMPPELQVSVRLIDSTGARRWQSDERLSYFGMPYFDFDKTLMTSYFLRLPADLTTGDYQIEILPYVPGQGEITPRLVTTIPLR